jgi:hypothetical protein
VEELIVPFRTRPTIAPEARSTIIVSAIQSLRGHGLLPRYEAALTPQQRERLFALTAGQWVPIETALEHYEAVDSLHLDDAIIQEIGAAVGVRLYQSVLGTFMKLSTQAGVTPWSVLPSVHRMIDVTWRGTDMAVWKRGPKDARLEWANQPCARIPYFGVSFASLLGTTVGMFCRKAYVTKILRACTPTKLSFQLSWV